MNNIERVLCQLRLEAVPSQNGTSMQLYDYRNTPVTSGPDVRTALLTLLNWAYQELNADPLLPAPEEGEPEIAWLMRVRDCCNTRIDALSES